MTISCGRTKQLDIIVGFLPHHWLYGWFSQFHSCGTYSVPSRIHSVEFSLHRNWCVVPQSYSCLSERKMLNSILPSSRPCNSHNLGNTTAITQFGRLLHGALQCSAVPIKFKSFSIWTQYLRSWYQNYSNQTTLDQVKSVVKRLLHSVSQPQHMSLHWICMQFVNRSYCGIILFWQIWIKWLSIRETREGAPICTWLSIVSCQRLCWRRRTGLWTTTTWTWLPFILHTSTRLHSWRSWLHTTSWSWLPTCWAWLPVITSWPWLRYDSTPLCFQVWGILNSAKLSSFFGC